MNTKFKTAFSIISLVATGVLFGSVCTVFYFKNRVDTARSLQSPDGFEKYYFDKLKIRTDQEDSLRNLLSQSYTEMDEFRTQVSENYNKILDSLNGRLANSLDDNQKLLLREHTNKLQEQIQKNVQASRSKSLTKENNINSLSNSLSKSSHENTAQELSPANKTEVGNSNKIDSSQVVKPKAEAAKINEKALATNSKTDNLPLEKHDKKEVANKATIDSNLSSNKGSAENEQVKSIATKSPEVEQEFSNLKKLEAEIFSQLDLSSELKTKITTILKETRTQIKDLKDELSDRPMLFKMRRKQVMQERNHRIMQLLSYEQKVKFKQLLKEKRERENEKSAGRP